MDEFYRTNPAFVVPYDYFKCITIVNPKQAAFYCSQGVKLRDVRPSTDRKSGEPILTYYFYRDETKEAYNAWCLREH